MVGSVQGSKEVGVLSTKEQVGHFMNLAAGSEDSGAIFDSLVLQVDSEFVPMVERHQRDEEKHATLLYQCAEVNGVEPYPVMGDLALFDRLMEALEPGTLMQTFLFLQVAEERACKQYAFILPFIAKVCPGTAQILAGIAQDEERHVLYCQRIASHHAPNIDNLRDTLAYYRQLEKPVFTKFAAAAVAVISELANG